MAIVGKRGRGARRHRVARLRGDGEAWWLPPGAARRAWLVAERAGGAPLRRAGGHARRSLAFLGQRRTDMPAGTFLFVISDFLADVPADAWLDAVGHGWDIVPVVIQDPVWERSWPEIGGVAVPVANPRTSRVELVRLSRRQAARRRTENAERYAELLAELESLGLRPVEIGASDPPAVDEVFLSWAEERRRGKWAR